VLEDPRCFKASQLGEWKSMRMSRGGRIGWVAKVRGVRNLWGAAPPDYRARQLTPYRTDDGQEIGELACLAPTRSLVGFGISPSGLGPPPRT
jgi:hypothetical protein